MRHPAEGTLRRLLDEPDGVADADRQHVAGCTACLTTLGSVREDAETAADALGAEPGTDPETGWSRLITAAREGDRGTAPAPARSSRRRSLRSPAVAALGVVALVAGGGAAAAANWLPIFRTEQVAAVQVTEADLVALPDLSDYGTLRVVEEPRLRSVDDAAAAERATGLDVPEVAELPRGVTGEPTFEVGGEVRAVFRFSADRARRAAAAAGEELPAPPAGLDGSRFRLVAGPGIASMWSSGSGLPALVVARAVAPAAYSDGVPFATARDYLLALPGLPDDLAAQLRGFSEDGATLPVPVPADEVATSPTDVDGRPATLFTSRDGALAGVVWVDDGVLTAVAGSLDDDEVLAVARGLRG